MAGFYVGVVKKGGRVSNTHFGNGAHSLGSNMTRVITLVCKKSVINILEKKTFLVFKCALKTQAYLGVK